MPSDSSNKDSGEDAPISPSQLPTLNTETDLTARRHFESAFRLQQSGKLYEAIAEYEKAAAVKGMFESYFNLGLCLRTAGKLSEAESAFARAAKINRRYKPIYKQLSEVQRLLGKVSEAEVSWSQYSML